MEEKLQYFMILKFLCLNYLLIFTFDLLHETDIYCLELIWFLLKSPIKLMSKRDNVEFESNVLEEK